MIRIILIFSLFLLSCKDPSPKKLSPKTSEPQTQPVNKGETFVQKQNQEKTGQAQTKALSIISDGSNRIGLKFLNGLEKDIMDYDPFLKTVKPESINFDGDLNYVASLSFTDLKDFDRISLLENATKYYKNSLIDADFLQYRATTGPKLIAKDKAVLLYTNKILQKPFKLQGVVGTAMVVNSEGKIIQRIDGIGIGEAALTEDGKYFLSMDGGEWGDGGSQHIQDKFMIYNVSSGQQIFTTTNLPHSPSVSSYQNFFIMLQYIDQSKRKYFVFEPKSKNVFYKSFLISEILNFKTFDADGIVMKDGSAFKFERDWTKVSFDNYNTSNLFGDYENKTEFR